jgi:two-component system chemotaxis response regulator CheB
MPDAEPEMTALNVSASMSGCSGQRCMAASVLLAVVLTGMGADGREGARLLKQSGSQVWAQDEASCVIYGMPMAIVKADLADAIYPLDEIGRHLAETCI